MGIGQLYTMQEQIKNNILETYFKELSIQIKLNGLSFCVFNPILNCIETIHTLNWEERTSPRVIEAKVGEFLKNESVVRQDFSIIRVMHSNELFTFVPSALFDEESAKQYLKYNVKVFPTDYIAYDRVEPLDLVVSYVPYVNINNLLLDYFGNFDYEHSSSVLLRTILSHKASHGKDIAYVHIEKEAFYLIVFKNNKLVFFNQFKHYSIEDFLYYLLFSLEQLEIDTESIPMYVMGDIDRRMLIYAAVYKYIRNVYFFCSLRQYAFCQDMDDRLVRRNFLLTHLF